MAKRATKRKNLVLRGDTWLFRKRIGGKVYRISTGCKDPNQAERRAVEIEKDINDGRFGWKPKATVPTVSEWAEKVSRSTAQSKRLASPSTFIRTIDNLAADATLGPLALDAVRVQDCREHLTRTYATHSPNSLRVYQSFCKALWNEARRNKLVTENPWCFKMPKRVLRPRVLLVSEQPAFYAALTPQYQRFVQVLLLTGLRNSELCNLKDDQVDFVRRTIIVLGKGQKYRSVPLTPECADVLRAQQQARDTGQLSRLHEVQRRRVAAHCIFPIVASTAIHNIAAAAKAAKLQTALTVHDLRRTFATRCAMSGVPMKDLQRWLGHSSITMTAEFYIHVPTDGDRDLALLSNMAKATGFSDTKAKAGDRATQSTKVVTFQRG